MTAPLTLPCAAVPGHPDFQALAALPDIAIELRYATANNFFGANVYGTLDLAYLRREAAQALDNAATWLGRQRPGYRLLVLDALRPQQVQERLYAKLSGTPLVRYLANPQIGSIHSFGMAVDVTLLDPQGREVDMGTGFDAMEPGSHPEYEVEHLAQGWLSAQHLVERGWLRAAMRQAGFHGISTEWWHFDFGDRTQVRATLPRVL